VTGALKGAIERGNGGISGRLSRKIAARLRSRYGSEGHRFQRAQELILVYQIDLECTRLLSIGKERTVRTLRQFFALIGPELSARFELLCSDVWKPIGA
jgi:transposase